MTEREKYAAGTEARRSLPGRAWTPDETHKQETLLRYLGAVASIATERAIERPAGRPAVGGAVGAEAEAEAGGEQPAAGQAAPGRPAAAPPVLRVRDVMDVPAAAVRSDLPFLDLARTLSREGLGAVPVVDDEDRVLGVVSESDLLAKAAVEAAPGRPGPLDRMRSHRLYEKAQGETAGTLMTVPAITVPPGMPVPEAARLAARARLKRLPVTDHRGRLVGVVRRIALLRALVRDDAKIRDEIETRVLAREFGLTRSAVEVTVENGVVDITGRVDRDAIPRLLEEIHRIDDVTEVVDHLVGA